jgi:hypothetical protein
MSHSDDRTPLHLSVAVITVMETTAGSLVITSEGCGGAGEWADRILDLMKVQLAAATESGSDDDRLSVDEDQFVEFLVDTPKEPR